tara:strand:+ start:55322 stop:55903 length:582 start_codon:yes stop_codon:yes gene_type:complete
MMKAFLKRDGQIFMADWRYYFPSWLFFFLILFALNMNGFNHNTVFFLLFFVLTLTFKDTFKSDQKFGLIDMLVVENKSLGVYIFSKILSNILFVLMPLLWVVFIFTPHFNFVLPGILMTVLGVMGASMQMAKNVSWMLHLILFPFMVPIFLILNMYDLHMIECVIMVYIFSGMLLIYLPLSILFGTLCLKLGD